MKSALLQTTIILVISTMASLNVLAQKRFDNPKQNRRIVITKTGPKATITENWIPLDSLSEEQRQKIYNALIRDSLTEANSDSDSTGAPKIHISAQGTVSNRTSGDSYTPRKIRWDLTIFATSLWEI